MWYTSLNNVNCRTNSIQRTLDQNLCNQTPAFVLKLGRTNSSFRLDRQSARLQSTPSVEVSTPEIIPLADWVRDRFSFHFAFHTLSKCHSDCTCRCRPSSSHIFSKWLTQLRFWNTACELSDNQTPHEMRKKTPKQKTDETWMCTTDKPSATAAEKWNENCSHPVRAGQILVWKSSEKMLL